MNDILNILPPEAGSIAAAWLLLEKVAKLVQPWIAAKAAQAIDRVIQYPEDQFALRRVFSSRIYRIIAFTSDLLLRVKMPGNVELDKAIVRAHTENKL